MMDALAADRLLGESSPEMFAFGSYSTGQREKVSNEWRAKNVSPILYRMHNRHDLMHKTLWAWAGTYRDGVRGKERIVVEYALARPMASTKQDDFVGRLLWAVSDPPGLPAKRFAEHDPVPPLDWLEPFGEARYGHADLVRFGVSPKPDRDDELAYSLTRRPPPYELAPPMSLVLPAIRATRWDEVMRQLARWLSRHLDDPMLFRWVVKHGSHLHADFVWWIERRLDELAKLEREGEIESLARIRSAAPNAIPRPVMRKLWGLLLSGRVKFWRGSVDLYLWQKRFRRDGLTTPLRLELRQVLAPLVSFREPYRWPDELTEHTERDRVKDIVDWEIVLATEHAHSAIEDIKEDEDWLKALPVLLPDFVSLLYEALILMQELDRANSKSDLSYLDQPSISAHPQNRDYRDWTVLIELTRDAWLATLQSAPEKARHQAEAWWDIPFTLFRRLAFFAAAHDVELVPSSALNWILRDDHWWLWSVETKREAIRLIVSLAPRLDDEECATLEAAVLTGPPRNMFKDDVESDRWEQLVDREVWLRLGKIEQTRALSGDEARQRFMALSEKHPQWQIAEDEKDEFPVWMGDGDDWREFIITPRLRRDLVEWLKKHSSSEHFQDDDWQQRCRDDFPTTACALYELAMEDVWPVSRWREALQAWSEERLLRRSWRYMAATVVVAPAPVLDDLARSISWWLQAIAKTFSNHEEIFVSLAQHVLAIDYDEAADEEGSDPVTRAINHPIGHVTEALLRWWYRRDLEDGQGLPQQLQNVFTQICDTRRHKFRHGRVLLATHVIALFRVDRDWAEEFLIPLFDWDRDEAEARYAWEGFLWSPRLYRPLLEIIKASFLETARHYDVLGKHDGQYATILTFAALDPADIFTRSELSGATRALPDDGLNEVARALVRALEGAGGQREEYWNNRVAPYLRAIWPKARDRNTPAISENLGHLCLAAGEAFPEAFAMLRAWLLPPAHPDYLVHTFYESGLVRKNPHLSLEFLDLVISDQAQWPPSDLGKCLQQIRDSAPELDDDNRFQRLSAYLRRHGHE